jgi:glycerol-3-phosphate dehydrogenase
MTRDLARLERTAFDALVIGAGIYGLALAWELTSRGATVAVVDRDDFGGQTSFNSLKTLHGGIRSLQHGALAEMRAFVRERRAIATIAPHLVRPLAFAVPTVRRPPRNRLVLGVFLALHDFLARDRNDGVDPLLKLAPSRILSRTAALELNPLIGGDGVTGAAVWYDYQMRSSERLAFAFLQSAVREGACAANYVDARELLRNGDRVIGARVTDRISGGWFDVRARAVVNATGPWAWTWLDRAGAKAAIARPALSKAMNFVVRRVTTDHALGGVARGRFLFIVPWRDHSIVGTSHHPFSGCADDLTVRSSEVRDFLSEVQDAFPRAGLTERDIRLVHRGLLPAVPATTRGHDDLLKESIVHAHDADGLPGLVTVMGVRYTTARGTAELAADRILSTLRQPAAPSRTARTPLFGGDIADLEAFERQAIAGAADLPPDTVRRLVALHGSHYTAILARLRSSGRLAEPLSADCAVTAGEIVHAIEAEMAVHLSDAVLRRTEVASAGHPGRQVLEKAAGVMASQLGWSEQRVLDEIASVERYFDDRG